ncbi:MAG: DUF5615 family PIN-like protein [Thermoanaerobaculia bacterium]
MRFLADESCDFAVVRALRASGHDVAAVAEMASRAEDRAVIEQAAEGKLILITEDKDFGQLVFAAGKPSAGVILIRFPSDQRRTLPQAIQELIRKKGNDLEGRFVVLQPGRVRIGAALPK